VGSLAAVIAVRDDLKAKSLREFTDVHRLSQRSEPMTGLIRVYTPTDDDGEKLPPESTRVQTNCHNILGTVRDSLSRLMDVELTQDVANTSAKADVIVRDVTLLRDVPVTYLLFLEKKLVDLRTFVLKMLVLDPAFEWSWDADLGAYKTPVVGTTRTKKVPFAFEKAPATDRHPAQVDVYQTDVIVGTWSTTRLSGAIPSSDRDEILSRIDMLTVAVKEARSRGNAIEATPVTAADTLFEFLWEGSLVG